MASTGATRRSRCAFELGAALAAQPGAARLQRRGARAQPLELLAPLGGRLLGRGRRAAQLVGAAGGRLPDGGLFLLRGHPVAAWADELGGIVGDGGVGAEEPGAVVAGGGAAVAGGVRAAG